MSRAFKNQLLASCSFPSWIGREDKFFSRKLRCRGKVAESSEVVRNAQGEFIGVRVKPEQEQLK